MAEQAAFHLKKWYMDGADAAGRAVIAYAASLRWRGIRVPYVSYIYLKQAGDCHVKSRLRNMAEPLVSEGAIRWSDKGLGFQGEWTPSGHSYRERLYEGPHGCLDWHCLQPGGFCQIELGTETPIAGTGYVECLEMTFPPWQLGLRELRWGRFAHPECPVVWIDWKGTLNRRWIFAEGRVFSDGTVEDNRVLAPECGLHLEMTQPEVIEQQEKIGAVVQSLSAFIPGLDRVAPLQFLKAKETKWLSSGILRIAGQAERSAPVIHELVTF